eukprot:jgi/Orpsp1_1/1176633/evm.model.c7180000058391.1
MKKNDITEDNVEKDDMEIENIEEDNIDENDKEIESNKSYIYCIISSSYYFSFEQNLIKIIPEKKGLKVIKSELIKIKENDKYAFSFKEYENLDFKNIYLFKADVILKDNANHSFKINLKYKREDLISNKSYTIGTNQHLFIYSQVFEQRSWLNRKIFNFISSSNNEMKKLNKTLSISFLQKFIIFKNFILHLYQEGRNILSDLFRDTLETICLLSIINFEFILVFFIDLNDLTENYIEILKLFDPSLTIYINLESYKKINIKNYKNNEYHQFINKFQENIKNFMIFNKISESLENSHNINTNILKKINEAIHKTGIYLIENNKFNNLEIIQFIQEDAQIYYKEYSEKKVMVDLIGHIHFESIDNNFCQIYIGSKGKYFDYANLYKTKYKNYLTELTKGVTSFDQLPILYRLLRINDNPCQKDHLLILLKVYIMNNLRRNDLNIKELGQLIGPMFKLVSDNDNEHLNHFISSTKNMFKEKEANVLFIIIINKYVNQLNEELIHKMFENVSELSIKETIIYLKHFHQNKKIKELLLGRLTNRDIKFDELFNVENTENMYLLFKLIELKFFKNDDRNEIIGESEYIKNTIDTMETFYHKLKTLNFSMEQLQKMDRLKHNNKLKSRFFLISLGKKDQCESLNKFISKKIDHYTEILRKIDEIISIFSVFYPRDKKEMIQYYIHLKSSIFQNPICDFPKREKLNYFPTINDQQQLNNKIIDNNSMINNPINYDELY